MTTPIDKTRMGPGPWQDEPDRIEWRSGELPCLIVRNNLGALCGYVGVPPGHPWHGVGYDDVPARAHGGLTFTGECSGHICHVAAPGEPENVWWVGFDCAHAGDLIPVSRRLGFSFGEESYKHVSYVRAEVERLAMQARAAC